MMFTDARHTYRYFVTIRTTYKDGRVVEKGGYDILARGEEQAKRAAYNWYIRGTQFPDDVLKREIVAVD